MTSRKQQYGRTRNPKKKDSNAFAKLLSWRDGTQTKASSNEKRSLSSNKAHLHNVPRIVEVHKLIQTYLLKCDDISRRNCEVLEAIDDLHSDAKSRQRDLRDGKQFQSTMSLWNQVNSSEGHKKLQAESSTGFETGKSKVQFASTMSVFPMEADAKSCYNADMTSGMYFSDKERSCIKIIENQREKKLSDKSSLLSHNRYMREKINELRKELKLQGSIVDQLGKNRQQQRQEITAIKNRITSEQTNKKLAYDLYNKALAEANQQVKEDKSLRQQRKQEMIEELGELSEDSAYDRVVRLPETAYLRPAPEKLYQNKTLAEHKQKNEDTKALTGEYEEILDKFFNMTKTESKNLTEAIESFDAENQEYLLQNKDARIFADKLENLKTFRDSIKEEIVAVKKDRIKTKTKRDDALDNFQEKIKENEAAIENYDKLKADTKRIILSIKIAIPEIFRKIQCEEFSEKDLDHDEVNENNILDYLSMIEKRSDEILTLYDPASDKPLGGQASSSAGFRHSGGFGGQMSHRLKKEQKRQKVQKDIESILGNKSGKVG